MRCIVVLVLQSLMLSKNVVDIHFIALHWDIIDCIQITRVVQISRCPHIPVFNSMYTSIKNIENEKK